MRLFSRKQAYDRKHILDEAARARKRRRNKKAISLYRKVLAVEPNNTELHAQIAPLLADVGWRFDAWESYRSAAQALLRNNARARALNLYRDATRRLPQCYDTWSTLSLLELQSGRREAAHATLRTARQEFRTRRTRPEAISLLRKLLELDPRDLPAALDLARLLSKTGREEEALHLLAQLATRTHGDELRRIRKTQWRITPTLIHTWLWLRSAMKSRTATA